MQVSSYEQHLSEAQAASFKALQDQLHSFQNEMAAASHLRTQLVDKDRQIDTIRHDSPRMLLAVASYICHKLHLMHKLITSDEGVRQLLQRPHVGSRKPWFSPSRPILWPASQTTGLPPCCSMPKASTTAI